jgi:hypothetical protein
MARPSRVAPRPARGPPLPGPASRRGPAAPAPAPPRVPRARRAGGYSSRRRPWWAPPVSPNRPFHSTPDARSFPLPPPPRPRRSEPPSTSSACTAFAPPTVSPDSSSSSLPRPFLPPARWPPPRGVPDPPPRPWRGPDEGRSMVRCVARSWRPGPARRVRPRPSAAYDHGTAPARCAARPPPPRAPLPPSRSALGGASATPRRGPPCTRAPSVVRRVRGMARPWRSGPAPARWPSPRGGPLLPRRGPRCLRVACPTQPARGGRATCSTQPARDGRATRSWRERLVRCARSVASSRCPWPRSVRPCTR